MIYIKKFCLLSILFISTLINVEASNKINVFVSILPQQYFVQQVGTDYVDVHVMVGPGQNPATYEPTPQQMAALANADIYFSIGVPFEKSWLDKIKENNSKLVVIECCESISSLDGHSHHDEHIDPHVWTSPKKVIQIATLIEKSLIEVDIKNSSNYITSVSSFISELNNLDNAIKSRIINLKKRTFIASHPSWSYFAKEYDLTQISIEQEGKEIQAKSMVKLIKLAKEKNIKAVFVQSQFNNKAAKIIAKEIDAIVFELDPLAFNYIENMNNVTDKIVQGLSL
jgi:zinc transport system substrate-binding protein